MSESYCKYCGQPGFFRMDGGFPRFYHEYGGCGSGWDSAKQLRGFRQSYQTTKIWYSASLSATVSDLRPGPCPWGCGELVWFIRHNGGCVYLDDLGYPWPVHECFADWWDDVELGTTRSDQYPDAVAKSDAPCLPAGWKRIQGAAKKADRDDVKFELGIIHAVAVYESKVRMWIRQPGGGWDEIAFHRIRFVNKLTGEPHAIDWQHIVGNLIGYSEYYCFLSSGARQRQAHTHWGYEPDQPDLRKALGLPPLPPPRRRP